jgi:hypothetical protein
MNYGAWYLQLNCKALWKFPKGTYVPGQHDMVVQESPSKAIVNQWQLANHKWWVHTLHKVEGPRVHGNVNGWKI